MEGTEGKKEKEIKQTKEANTESKIIFVKYTKDIKTYNKFMNDLFSELKNNHFSFTKKNKKELLKNMNNNVKNLVIFIFQLNEAENKCIYYCLSCIFGGFLGDALGAYCEFKGPNMNNINKILKGKPMFGDDPGQVTDDSEMAMCSGFALMDNPNFDDINSDYLFYYYGLWYKSKPRDIGNTTRKALKIFDTEKFNPNSNNNYEEEFKKIKKSNDNSLANGFLMRTSPFIVWCYFRFNDKIINVLKQSNPNPKELFELFQNIQVQARKDNICTHPNDSLSAAHSLFCIMSLCAICEAKPIQIIKTIILLLKNDYFNNYEIKDIKEMIMHEYNNYEADKDGKLSEIKYSFIYFTEGKNNVNIHMGFYYHAFRLTLYFLYYFDKIKEDHNYSKYRTIMNQICAFGGDTDTNAAIVGTVIGPLIGYKYFGEEDLQTMISLVPKKRCIFSPALMIIYVYYLKNDKFKGKNNFNFLKMFLTIIFDKIDVNNLDNIFSSFDYSDENIE